jgi:hypothetical protein
VLKTSSLLICFALAAFGQKQSSGGLTAPDTKSSKPTPRTADGHPDLSGFWRGTRNTKPVGNIGKDLPGFKLPLTPAGEAALEFNKTKTIDPESLCILGGIPRHNASGLPFEVIQGKDKLAFLYWYSYFRLIPVGAGIRHTDDPDPTFFGEEVGHWEGDTLVIDSIAFKDERVWIDENANPHSDQLHTVERWTRPDFDHIHVDTLIEDPGSTRNPSTTHAPGFSVNPTTTFMSSCAARTMWTATISARGPAKSVPTASAAMRENSNRCPHP